ncbi:MAG: hypothetical protein FWE62_07045, partial [Firmicutes bacterium]|nr:hypothetical protein [Bacillota bacterium]
LEGLPVRVSGACGTADALFSDGRAARFELVPDGGQSRLVIDHLPPWEMVLLRIKNESTEKIREKS